MTEQKRILLLILIMTMVALIVGVISIVVLYQTALAEEKTRLVETAQSQARLMEAMARFDAIYSQNYPGGAEAATLSQIRDAHEHYNGFGQTGEFTLAKREGDIMVFLLNQRHQDLSNPQAVPFNAELAEPMRRSLSGQSGTVIGLDYHGETVLAAYEPVSELGWGIVAKIDLAEVQAPFVRAGLIAGPVAIAVIFLGALLFLKITNPLLAQLQESEARFRRAVVDAPFPIMIHAEDGEVVQINKVWTELTGYHPQEIATIAAWAEKAYGQRAELVREDIDRLYDMDKRLDEGEYTITTKSNHQRIWHFGSSPLGKDRSGRRLVMSSATDVTEQKLAEKKVKEYTERLEEMVEERTQSLEVAQERLLRQEKLAVLGQMAGSVGHELRNPLGVLTNVVYILSIKLAEADETVKEYLNILSVEIRKSDKIISDLLNFSRKQSAEREWVPVSALVEQVLAEQPPPAAITTATHIAPALPPVFVDPQQIRQVLTNLVTNAYQAMNASSSSPKTEVTPDCLTITANVDENYIRLSISDTGSGISPENITMIFDPLFTTKSKGIGLGLAVSKQLAESNGGSLEVESRENRGSTFTLVLPTTEINL